MSNHPGQWKPGQSGNPSGLPGRPLGSRNVFSAAFDRDLAEVWAAEGKEAMVKTAKKQPGLFFGVCARLLPQQVQVDVQQTFGGLDAAHREILEAIKQSIPDANDRQPGEVLQYVLEAIRAHGAKTVECVEKPLENLDPQT